MDNILDNTCNGKCSQCGECCGAFLPLTKKEVKIIRDTIKKYNLQWNPADNIIGNDFHMLCPMLDLKTRKCKLHSIDPKLKPAVCRRFICSNSKENLIKNAKFYDSRADYNGESGNFKPMDLLFYDSPIYLINFATKELHQNTPEKLMKFLDSTDNHDVAEAILDGRIQLDWSEE